MGIVEKAVGSPRVWLNTPVEVIIPRYLGQMAAILLLEMFLMFFVFGLNIAYPCKDGEGCKSKSGQVRDNNYTTTHCQGYRRKDCRLAISLKIETLKYHEPDPAPEGSGTCGQLKSIGLSTRVGYVWLPAA